jgi:hypothetical protein
MRGPVPIHARILDGIHYVFREGDEHIFKIGRTKNSVEETRVALCRGNSRPLTTVDTIETDEEVICETYLHQALRSKREVGGGGFEFFRLGLEELREVLADARRYLDEVVTVKREAEEFKLAEVDLALPQVLPNDDDFRTYTQLLEVREQIDRLMIQRKFYESKLMLRIGLSPGMFRIATWKTQSRVSIDCQAFQQQEPAIFDQIFPRFGRETFSRFFRLQKSGRQS